MSSLQSQAAGRFTLPPDAKGLSLKEKVESMLDESHLTTLAEMGEWSWEIRTVPVEEITCDDALAPRRNAALQERSRAVARAQLTVGMAPPLIVIDTDNILLDGYSRLTLLEELDEQEAVVYHGTLATAGEIK